MVARGANPAYTQVAGETGVLCLRVFAGWCTITCWSEQTGWMLDSSSVGWGRIHRYQCIHSAYLSSVGVVLRKTLETNRIKVN